MPPKRRVQPLNLPNLFATTGFDSEKFRNEYYSTMPAGVANVEERDKALRAIEAMKRYNAKIFYTDKEIERRFLAKQVKEQRKKKYEQDVVRALSEYFEQNQVLPKDIPPKYKKLLREYILNLQKHPPAGKAAPHMPDELNIPHGPLDPLQGMYVNKNGTVTTTPMPAIPSKLNPNQPRDYHEAIQVYQKMPEKNFIVIDVTEPYFWKFAKYANQRKVPIIYELDDEGYIFNGIVLPKESAIAFAEFMNNEPQAKEYVNLHYPPQVHIGFPGQLTRNYRLNMRRAGRNGKVPRIPFPDRLPENFKTIEDIDRDEDLQRVAAAVGAPDDLNDAAAAAAAAVDGEDGIDDGGMPNFGNDDAVPGENEKDEKDLAKGEEEKNEALEIPSEAEATETDMFPEINKKVLPGTRELDYDNAVIPMPFFTRTIGYMFNPTWGDNQNMNEWINTLPEEVRREYSDIMMRFVRLNGSMRAYEEKSLPRILDQRGDETGRWVRLGSIMKDKKNGRELLSALNSVVADLTAFFERYAKQERRDYFLQRLQRIYTFGVDKTEAPKLFSVGKGALNEDEYEAGAELYACGRINHFGPRRYLHQRVHPFVRLRPFDTPETMVREQTTKNDEMREKFRSEHKMVHGIDPSNERIATAMPTLAQPFNYDYMRFNMHSIPAKRSRYNFLGI